MSERTQHPELRRTKVVATIGPASEDPAILQAMVRAGMNVARINLSHESYEVHAERIRRVRAVAAELGAQVAIMLDTRGLEIRTGRLEAGPVSLVPGQAFVLRTDPRPGDATGVAVSVPELVAQVRPGERIFLDDGAIELVVEEADPAQGEIRTRVVCGGVLKDHRGVNLPDTFLVLTSLREINQEDLRFAASQEVEYLAASFVRNRYDVWEIRECLAELGAEIPIIAKIETRQAVENLEEIVEAADGTMVARGDLGVEMPLEQVPTIQKRIIRATVTNGKPVITATQMLDSMERNPRPTRAEVSDVANAIFDGTSAVMLSGETAVGAYPVESVRTMAALALHAEAHLSEYGYLQKIVPEESARLTEAVAQAAVTMSHHLGAAAIVTLTQTGFTSRMISKYRPQAPIMAVTTSPKVARKLALNWGVVPIRYVGEHTSDEELFAYTLREGRRRGYFQRGDRVVATAGITGQARSTSTIRVLTVEE